MNGHDETLSILTECARMTDHEGVTAPFVLTRQAVLEIKGKSLRKTTQPYHCRLMVMTSRNYS